MNAIRLNLDSEHYCAYAKVHSELENLTSLRSQLPTDIKGAETALDAKQIKLTQQQKTWRGFLVKILLGQAGILSKIHSWLQKFVWYKDEVIVQTDLEDKIGRRQEVLAKTKETIRKIDELKVDNQALLDSYPQLNNIQNVFNLIVQACGGQDKYDRLPILTPKTGTDFTLFDLSNISSSEMTASLMRFTYKEGNDTMPGLAMRIQNSVWKHPKGVQTVFQHLINEASWAVAGRRFLQPLGYLIQKGIVKEYDFKQLETLLSKGKVVNGTQSFELV